MTTFTVNIPNNKVSFFKEFLELIGSTYIQNDDFSLTEEEKNILDERLQEDEKEYISAKKSIKALKSKYGI